MLPTTNLRELEHIAIRQALAKCGGEKGPAAKLLGIGEASLARKLADHATEVYKIATRQTAANG